GHVGVEGGAFRRPHAPGRVLHLVLERGAVAPPAVAPVVLGDEGLVGFGQRHLRRTHRGRREAFPAAVVTPLVREAAAHHAAGDRATHWQRPVGLAVGHTREPRDGGTRHQLAHEDDAASHLTRFRLTAYVEAQVHLVE